MAKELTPMQKKIRQQARSMAEDAGKDWKMLSKEERKGFMREARGAAGRSAGGRLKGGPDIVTRSEGAAQGSEKAANPARERAMEAARSAGLNWQKLSADRRRAFMRKARDRGE